VVPPKETVERLHPLMPILGIITRIANITGLDTIGLPVVVGSAVRCPPTSRRTRSPLAPATWTRCG